MPVADIAKIDAFVRELQFLKKSKKPMGRFAVQVDMNQELRYALLDEYASLAATQLRLCAWKVWGDLDKIPARLRVELEDIGVLDGQ